MMMEATETNRTIARVLVLDVGQVCIGLTPDRCAEMLKVEQLEQVLVAYPEISALIEQLEIGQIDADAFVFAASSMMRMSQETVRLAWMANLGKELPGVASIVQEALDAGLKVVLMSDTSEMHADAFLAALSFRDQLAGTVLSYEVGARKPAAAMYETLETTFCNGGVPLLFADDKKGNTNAAQARGWNTFTMVNQDVEGLRAALREQLGR
jgi:FMN phosphatase YigB (HAD superfamily)